MDSSVSRDTKRDALHRARQHDLDVAVIAKETVRMILEAAFAVSVLDEGVARTWLIM
jgi:nuclear pore complex protein Nup107